MKTKAAARLFAIFCACSSLAVQAETIEGVLEQGKVYSALFTVSPESGDLIGFAAKNQSAQQK